jgi:phage shock protein PspC (stress-responsive transcriptional regulator)
MSLEAVADTRARTRVEEPWIVGGVAAGLAALTPLPVGWIRAGIFLMILGTHFWLGLGIYAVAALVVPHRGRWLPSWSNVVGLLRAASFGLMAFLSRSIDLTSTGFFSQGPVVWIPVGGLLLIGWAAVLTSPRLEPSDEDRSVALTGAPALGLGAVLFVVIWLAPGIRADVVLDLGLVVVGGVLVLMRPRVPGSAVAFAPVVALGLVAIACGFSGADLGGGIGKTFVAPRTVSRHANYRRAIGTVTFDARRWRGVAGRTEHVTLSVGIGNISIIVPQDVYATVDARLGNGQLAGGPVIESFFVHSRFLAGWMPYRPPLRPGRLQITAQVGDGCLSVTQEPGSFSDSNC